MILNGKLTTKEGVQVACFPSQVIRITQGENTNYSHYGTKNVDNASGVGKRDIYAPVDVVCAGNQGSAYGLVLYQSTEKVLLANGQIDYLSMWLMHDNDVSQWQIGKVYRQGELIYREGNADASGQTTGIHVHYEVAQGLHSRRIRSVEGGGMHITPQSSIDDIFFSNLTQVVRQNAEGSDKGQRTFKFKKYDGESGGGGIDPNGNQNNIITAMIVRALPNQL